MIAELTTGKFLLVDGAMGTMLQKRGLPVGVPPELFNLSHPEILTKVHQEYVAAGADIITANTFQANRYKLPREQLSQVISSGIALARAAKPKYVAYDMGPIGQMMAPMGTLTFTEAYEAFKEQAILAEQAGADLVILETLSDLLEMKSAILAIKENTALPIIATMTFQEDGRTFVGTDPVTATLTLQALGVAALGVNCSLGPQELLPVVKQICQYAKVPVAVQANAGLPQMEAGETVYRISVQAYTQAVAEMLDLGVTVIGGCCGTTPAFTKALRDLLAKRQPVLPQPVSVTAVTSGVATVVLNEGLTVIGERLNPTGKKRLKEAIRQKDHGYLMRSAIEQVTAGADLLDVNVGLPEINEAQMMATVVAHLQEVVNQPLQIDSADATAIEAGCRIYNGRPLINSVNGEEAVMARIFPIVKKYGGVVLGLALDKKGIPETAVQRLAIAKRIVKTAASYGIAKEDVLIDPLVLTASAQQEQVQVTIDTLKLLRAEGICTVAGISNVSFGLPNRPLLNSTFLAACVSAGLNAAIMDPLSEIMMATVGALRVINGQDGEARNYIAHSQQLAISVAPTDQPLPPPAEEDSLQRMIKTGRKEEAPLKTKELLRSKTPLEIVNEEFLPALNEMGTAFEKGQVFLPQLMQSAETVKQAQEVLKAELAKTDQTAISAGKILLATVEGDIHDIGKNIVKMILENYGFQVIDLGKDVPIQTVVTTIQQEEIKLVGLSALMTTTVHNMKKTIAAVKAAGLDCSFMVGGAVLNEEYRAFVGADYYAKDAMASVLIAQRFFAEDGNVKKES